MASNRELKIAEAKGMQLYAQEIAKATGGKVLQDGGKGGFSTDTRTLKPGEWFVPLVGPNYDGHDFLPVAQRTGCVGALGHPGTMPADWLGGFVEVPDTLQAFQDLASFARTIYKGPVVGITGSSGKTSTRAMVALALRSLGPVHQTSGNLNNHIGVPRTLLDLDMEAAACVLELGMNHAGEIACLAAICRPTMRVVINVGPVHIGNLGSLHAVAAAKGELFDSARPGDVCVINADDPLVAALPLPSTVNVDVDVVRFGRSAGCDVRLVASEPAWDGEAVRAIIEGPDRPRGTVGHEDRQLQLRAQGGTAHPNKREGAQFNVESARGTGGNVEDGSRRTCGGGGAGQTLAERAREAKGDTIAPGGAEVLPGRRRVEVVIPSPGLHLAETACAAIAVAWSLGVHIEEACAALSDYAPVGHRMKLERLSGRRQIRLIDDSYNSNPMSLRAALELLASTPCTGRRVALIGDMLELGEFSETEHRKALETCFKLALDVVGVAGPVFLRAIHDAQQEVSTSRGASLADSSDEDASEDEGVVLAEPDAPRLAEAVASHLRDGDLVLVKGSRGMKMEIVSDALRNLS